MKKIYCHVMDDGGFTFGMDDRTPVSWEFSSRPRKHVYRTFVIENPTLAAQAFVKMRPVTVRTYQEIRAMFKVLMEAQP